MVPFFIEVTLLLMLSFHIREKYDMSTLKSEIKMGTIAELGSKLDDLHLNAEKEVIQCLGAKAALIEASKMIEQHMAYVDKDRDDGKLDQEQAQMVKKYIQHCMGIVANLATVAEVRHYQATGKLQAGEMAIKIARSMYDAEKGKLTALLAAEDDAEVGGDSEDGGRRPGTRPADPLADRREPKPELLVEEAPKHECTEEGGCKAADCDK